MLNVNRKVTDQFYRYKMPRIIAKVEGKGNGIKTVIVNMAEIGKALYRPPAYPTKFFGCELGAQTQIDKKNDRYIVNGSHTSEKLQEILDSFIEKFVLCESCDNPETTFVVQPKKEKITSVCSACGNSSLIDMRHRLATFIVKNPPIDDSATPQKLKKLRKEKGSQENGDASPTEESGFDGWSDDIPANDTSIDDWSEDTSKEAVQKRMEQLGDGVKGLTYHDDLEKSVEERFNLFFKFVKNKIRAGTENIPSKDIVAEAERLDIKDKAVIALAELLFSDNILAQITQYRVLLLHFLANNQKAQKHFMGAFELLVGQYFPNKLMPKVAHILKSFYDNDLVEEEVLLEWGSKVSKKYVKKSVSEQIHAKAKPFIDWLKTADEESDEEDEVEVVYTNRSEAAVLKEEAMKKAPPPPAEEDDLDIDDI
ncbi:eukaryotic translation initiation factor 5-like [Hydractinia symbiolongicarpus]|uniref:eukaryotic translation initiation factor 5-like n=1 Tax=Hydractinia symbiolongicarpus TaxID=13093 RepID=UPI00254EA09D|nr:eukaryotic translation initiation factor 5-like [Hydractinia symbiolongicarpus]XP_057315025.1 eukaryotic translation initiation factor 5-like [Hydractinia symbiolongicarpus]